MIKRTSLVWKRPELSDAEFKRLWLGEHAAVARRLVGVREYVIDFIADPPKGVPHGIATLRFDSRADLERAFADQALKDELMRTRAEFAAEVQVVIVDEQVVISSPSPRSHNR